MTSRSAIIGSTDRPRSWLNVGWAAVLTREPAVPLPDPHPASAAVASGDVTYCASILPWRSCGNRPPWEGERHENKTLATVNTLDAALPVGPLVWGGDWNHALSGTERSGSNGGRTAIVQMLEHRRLQVPTSGLPRRNPEVLSIDHIAADQNARIVRAEWFTAHGLSDHDGYVVEAEVGPSLE